MLGTDRRHARALIVGLLLVVTFSILSFAVARNFTANFDNSILLALRAAGNLAEPLGPRWLQEVVRDVTALGGTTFLAFVTLTVAVYFLLVNKRAFAVLLVTTVAGGAIVNSLLKLGFDRPRPDTPYATLMTTASFPSGHAAISAITFLTLGVMLSRATSSHRLRVYFIGVAVFLSLAVGLSRVYLGVHYATDVLAGWLVAAAWALLCWSVALALQKSGDVEPPK